MTQQTWPVSPDWGARLAPNEPGEGDLPGFYFVQRQAGYYEFRMLGGFKLDETQGVWTGTRAESQDFHTNDSALRVEVEYHAWLDFL